MTAIALPSGRPGTRRAVAAFARFELLRTIRNRRYLMFAAGFPVFFYLLYTHLGGGGDGSRDASWRAYFLVSMATYGAIGASLFVANVVAHERASGWTRQLRVTPLPPAAYVLTKLLVSFATSLPSLALVSIAAIVVNHVGLPADAWVRLLVGLAVGALPFVGLGLLIGLTAGPETTQIVVMIVYFGLAIVGGLWAPLSSLPDQVAVVGRLLPSYRLADLGWQVVGGSSFDPADVAVLAAYGIVIAGVVGLVYRRQEQRTRG